MMRLLMLVAAIAGGWYAWHSQMPRTWAPGILVKYEPLQVNLDNGQTFQKGDYAVHALASYRMDARVLSKKYYSDDFMPYDLALGWQQMSDSALLAKLDIGQFDRFYYYRWSEDPPPADPHVIAATSANTHMIPANDKVLATLKRIREGDLIHLEGYLVMARRADDWVVTSSTSRTDQGAGACEVVWVESLTILDKPPA